MNKRGFFFTNNKAQVWVETVIYTLIAFAMIGVVLSVVKPKIEEFQDKAVIEQSVKMMIDIDSVISDVTKRGTGNQRSIELKIKKGSLKISGINDKLVFEVESRYQYSEPGADYSESGLAILTEKKGDLNLVQILKDYNSKYNITYQQLDNIKTITATPTPYNLIISNKGDDENGRTAINFEII